MCNDSQVNRDRQSILKLFLSRIGALGLVIVSSLVIGYFPIDIRNATAITLFTVGVPSTGLAILAQPGRRHSDSIGRALVRFVIPASVISSLAGLAVFYLTLLMALPGIGAPTSGQPEVIVQAALPEARTALTVFLVYCGLFLIVFVEPPNRWFAVVEPPTRDRRPTIMAIVLAILFGLVLLVPAGRAFFALSPISVPVALVILASLAAWLLVLRVFWRRRIIVRTGVSKLGSPVLSPRLSAPRRHILVRGFNSPLVPSSRMMAGRTKFRLKRKWRGLNQV